VGFAVYIGLVRMIERRPVSELALPGMSRELGLGLLIGAGLYTACILILMVMGVYKIDRLNPVSYLLPAIAIPLSLGIFEEFLFRGVLFRIVEEWLASPRRWAGLDGGEYARGLGGQPTRLVGSVFRWRNSGFRDGRGGSAGICLVELARALLLSLPQVRTLRGRHQR